MRISSLVRFLAVAGLTWLLVLPASAAAFPVTGKCSITLISRDEAGKTLDTAKAGDESATAGDPLLVDWFGTVSWEGQSTVALKDNHYHVAMFGMVTPFQGEASNSADVRNTAGTFAFKANAPFRFTGTYYMSAGIVAANGTQCSGNFVVKLVGEPIQTVPFFVGLALLAIGALLLVWGFAGHLGAAIFGGIVLGLGAAIEAVIFGVLPLGGLTPVSLMATGIFLAVVSAIVGGRRMRSLDRALAAEAAAAAEVVEPAQVFAPPAALDGAEAEPDGAAEAEAEAPTEAAADASAESTPEAAAADAAAVEEAAPAAEPVPDAANAADAPGPTESGPEPEPVAAAVSPARAPDDPWPAADLAPRTGTEPGWFQDTDRA